MLASCRRRLLLRISKIPGGGGGTNPLRSIPRAIPFAHSYASTAVSSVCPGTVSYLISCGLSPAAAAAKATTQKIRSTGKADAVRALLRDYGFTDADIARAVRSSPKTLTLHPERILRPKLDFFASLGFEPRKLATVAYLFVRSLDKHLVPSIQFIRDIIGNDDDLRLAFSRMPRALTVDVDRYMRPAVEALRRCGFTEETISKLLVIKLSVLMTSPGRISEIFEELKAMGMHISDSRFLKCFSAMSILKRGTWLRKLELFESFGLSEGEVLKAWKTQPSIFQSSDDNVKKKVRFLLDELELEICDIIVRPVILCYSLDKCILPRCAVLSVLMRDGKIQRDIKLVKALIGNSKVFSAKYVVRHADHVPDVVKAYEGKIKFEGFIQ